jgi:hypothetical protein
MSFTRKFVVCLASFVWIGVSAAAPAAMHDRPGGKNDGGAVRRWNQIATDSVVVTGATAPALAGVLMAIVQLAVYDAVAGIKGGYEPYGSPVDAPDGASVDAAVAQSAHDVLVDLLPAQVAALDALLVESLAAVPDGQAKTDGIWVGRQAAAEILAARSADGRAANAPYTFLPPGPGIYQPTPPAFSTSPLVPWVAHVRPFIMTSPSEFRPGPPPSLRSRKWAAAYNLTKTVGDANSDVRTPEQSEIAIFWTEHTVRHWNRNINLQSDRAGLNDLQTARLLAMSNAAMADSWIGCWDAKYHYSFWRPVTAIRQGDTDPRADTAGDPNWTPFVTTPNHPEYPGAHACVSTAASLVLKHFFRDDDTSFPMEALVGGVRYVHTFSRYTDAGAEARSARLFGGMHYTFSNEAGARIGRHVVEAMLERGMFRRVPRRH